jgi:hypothetical protein
MSSFVLPWATSCHCHQLCRQVHSTPYPLLFVIFIFFYFVLCYRRQWQVVDRHCLFLCVALVQKTTVSSCIVCCHLLCVIKRVLICNTLIKFTLNLLNSFARFFYKHQFQTQILHLKRFILQCKMSMEMQWKKMNGFMKAQEGVARLMHALFLMMPSGCFVDTWTKHMASRCN